MPVFKISFSKFPSLFPNDSILTIAEKFIEKKGKVREGSKKSCQTTVKQGKQKRMPIFYGQPPKKS
jgi:hypothetical protein